MAIRFACIAGLMTKRVAMNLGKVFREHREASGFTQRQLHDCTGISCGFVSDFENGKRGISVETFVLLCEALVIDPAYMLAMAMRRNRADGKD